MKTTLSAPTQDDYDVHVEIVDPQIVALHDNEGDMELHRDQSITLIRWLLKEGFVEREEIE